MTYLEISRQLAEAGVESPEWDAALLMEHFCGVDATLARMDPERDYPSEELERAVWARASRYPLQYLLGTWQFYRQTYEVSPDCLIPRSDTEALVDDAIHRLPEGARFLDLCTGSGCIAISILAERPDTTALAVDKFPATLALAERNAVRNGVRDRFGPLLADVLDPAAIRLGAGVDAILSNPPYIATDVLKGLSPEVHAEPQEALDGGIDGLAFYRAILAHHSHLLKPDGFIAFEIGYDQAAAVLALGAEQGFLDGCVLRDLGGNNRVVVLKRPKTEPNVTD